MRLNNRDTLFLLCLNDSVSISFVIAKKMHDKINKVKLLLSFYRKSKKDRNFAKFSLALSYSKLSVLPWSFSLPLLQGSWRRYKVFRLRCLLPRLLSLFSHQTFIRIDAISPGPQLR